MREAENYVLEPTLRHIHAAGVGRSSTDFRRLESTTQAVLDLITGDLLPRFVGSLDPISLARLAQANRLIKINIDRFMGNQNRHPTAIMARQIRRIAINPHEALDSSSLTPDVERGLAALSSTSAERVRLRLRQLGFNDIERTNPRNFHTIFVRDAVNSGVQMRTSYNAYQRIRMLCAVTLLIRSLFIFTTLLLWLSTSSKLYPNLSNLLKILLITCLVIECVITSTTCRAMQRINGIDHSLRTAGQPPARHTHTILPR